MSALSPRDPATQDALDTMHDAGLLRTPPALALVTTLTTIRPGSVGAAIDWLVAHREELEQTYAEGATARIGPAKLPPELRYSPEIGGLDRPRDDHRLRERWLFADIVGQKSFFQAAVYAMTGVELSDGQAAMLDEFGTLNLLVDPRVWPMAATRRVAARGGGYTAAVVTGAAMMGSPVLAGEAAAECARFLMRARQAELDGTSPEALIAATLARHERVMGFGRPVVGPDERVPHTERLLARHGRAELPYVRLLRALDAAMLAQKGLGSTAAAWSAAILLDLGLSPEGVLAVSNYWVHANVFAQALFSCERGLGPTGGA